eukprot:309192_1
MKLSHDVLKQTQKRLLLKTFASIKSTDYMDLSGVLVALSDTALSILSETPLEQLSKALKKESVSRQYTSNLSVIEKQIFHIINDIVNVSHITLLIIEFYQPFQWDENIKPRNCVIDNNGHRMKCHSGTTGQWEHVIGKQGARFLSFKIKLDNINDNGNNVCIGIISKPIVANTAGGGYNGNGSVCAFGAEWFSGNDSGYIHLPTGKIGRWNTGHIVWIEADTDTSIIKYEWGFGKNKRTETLNFEKMSGDIYPVVCIWYKNDTVSFV